MSFNYHHTNISRSNYEEFFLLYVDNELTQIERREVEAFAAANPDLKEELDVLTGMKLPVQSVPFDKEVLLATNMKLTEMDEALLFYIDDELTTSEKSAVAHKIESDPAWQKQYSPLLTTKLYSETILFPHKKDLYRRSEKVRTIPAWMRIAAAVIILAGAGSMVFFNNNNTSPVNTTASVKPEVKKGLQQEQSNINTVVTIPGNAIAAAEKTEKILSKTTQKFIAKNTTPEVSNNIEIGAEETVAINRTRPSEILIEPIETTRQPQHIVNNMAVTPTIPQTLNISNTTTSTVPMDEVASNNNGKERMGVKGFLRKATRLIERRTGIAATNEDEELLIGAVSVKLK